MKQTAIDQEEKVISFCYSPFIISRRNIQDNGILILQEVPLKNKNLARLN
jgi:hypothetical protein